jgi:hypothetical protein
MRPLLRLLISALSAPSLEKSFAVEGKLSFRIFYFFVSRYSSYSREYGTGATGERRNDADVSL